MIRRVRRPSVHNELLTELIDKENGVFETYKDAMVFAAALGASKQRREPFEQVAEPIDYQIFARYGDQLALFSALALCALQNIQILSTERSDERLTIFEEYANGGLNLISEARGRYEQPLVGVIQRLIKEAIDSGDISDTGEGFRKVMEELGSGSRSLIG